MTSMNSFGAHDTLEVGDNSYEIYRLDAVPGTEKLPYSLKVLAENLLRTEDGANITKDHIEAIANWDPSAEPEHRDPVHSRAGDHAGLHRCAVHRRPRHHARGRRRPRRRYREGEPAGARRNGDRPLGDRRRVRQRRTPSSATSTSSTTATASATSSCAGARAPSTTSRWCRRAPASCTRSTSSTWPAPSWCAVNGRVAYPDTCVGTDSHTTMVNGLGVLGWGVGGIEAEAAMLGQPVSMLIPRVVGFKLTGEIKPGVTATDVVLTVTEMLRKHGVVGKFVEFYGKGVAEVPLANRATLGNMSPEFGSTAAIFPIDEVTIDYLRLTGRTEEQLALVEAYAKAQGMWHNPDREPVFSEYLELDLGDVVPSIAGPKRPQDRILLSDVQDRLPQGHPQLRRGAPSGTGDQTRRGRRRVVPGQRFGLAVLRRRRGSRRPSVGGQRLRRPAEQAGDGALGRAGRVRAGSRRRRRRGHHLVHQHLESVGDARRRTAGPKRGRQGPVFQAVGQDVDGARVAGRQRLLRQGRGLALPGEAGLLPGRLRLHHLHRQHRPAAGRDLEGHQRQRSLGDRGALGQPQLRGPYLPRREDELPGLPAAGDRLRTCRHHGLRLRDRTAGQRQ